MKEDTKILEFNEQSMTGKAMTAIDNTGEGVTELGEIRRACDELNEQKDSIPIPERLNVTYDEREFLTERTTNSSGEEETQITFGLEVKTDD